MQDDTIRFDGSIETEEDLETAFASLLRAANDSDLEPQGTWDIENGPGYPDWEVMVLELVREDK